MMLWKHLEKKEGSYCLSCDCCIRCRATKDLHSICLLRDGMKETWSLRILLHCWRDWYSLCADLTVSFYSHVHSGQTSYSSNIEHSICSMTFLSDFGFVEVSTALLHDDDQICHCLGLCLTCFRLYILCLCLCQMRDVLWRLVLWSLLSDWVLFHVPKVIQSTILLRKF